MNAPRPVSSRPSSTRSTDRPIHEPEATRAILERQRVAERCRISEPPRGNPGTAWHRSCHTVPQIITTVGWINGVGNDLVLFKDFVEMRGRETGGGRGEIRQDRKTA